MLNLLTAATLPHRLLTLCFRIRHTLCTALRIALYPLFAYVLYHPKIVWPKRWTTENPGLYGKDCEIHLCTTDGTHKRTLEYSHPKMSKNPKTYSHKFKQAGLAYEIALAIYESKCVHINGPFDASVHDKTIFEDPTLDEDGKPKGLMYKIPKGKKVIGDKGYRGFLDIVST